MSKKNDMVFPTSLSEIAFTLVFLLMLLMGSLLVQENRAKEEAQKRLAEAEETKSAESVTQALREANQELTTALTAGGHPKPSEVITRLREASETRAERDTLRQQVRELDERLTALTALREQIRQAANGQSERVTREQIETALALQEQIRKLVQDPEQEGGKPQDTKDPAPASMPTQKALGNKETLERIKQAMTSTGELRRQVKDRLDREIKPGEEKETINQVVAAARNFEELAKSKANPEALRKENADLRGQLAFVWRQLNTKGGLDHAPCWADEKGKIEYLFSVETRPEGYLVTKAWPPHREQEARALPGIEQALAGDVMPPARFATTVQPILNWSKKQDPECRHFVYLRTTISDGNQRDNARKLVEGFFYKLETQRSAQP